MAKKKQQINIVLLFLVIILTVKCANQMPPMGGPEDTTPPTILSIYPDNGTTNFNERYIEIAFSEYVDRRSVQDAIFISPPLEGVEYDWSGKELTLELPDSLKENTTYVIVIGTDLYDINNRNNMEESVLFAISTGDSIDMGVITGKVYDDKPQGVMIYGYKIDSLNFNPLEAEPGYVSQVGKNGEFKLYGIGDGNYRVFAVEDQLKNNVYNIGDDRYGAPFSDISIAGNDTVFTGLDFKLSKEDTTKPQLVSATMTDRVHILIEFTEFVDSTKLGKDNFYIVDSTEVKTFYPNNLFKGKAKDFQYYLTLNDSLNTENDLYLFSKNIVDLSSNISEEESVSFVASAEADTLVPSIHDKSTQHDGNAIDLNNPFITLSFDDAIDFSNVKTAIKLIDKKGTTLKSDIQLLDGASLKLSIHDKIKTRDEYELIVDYNLLPDMAGNKKETIDSVKIKALNDLGFSGVSGKVLSEKTNLFVVINSADKGKQKYSAKVTQNGEYDIKEVKPGKYLAWVFEDYDSSGTYSYGSVYPYTKSEKFVYYPDTLNLRARWPVGGVNIKFD